MPNEREEGGLAGRMFLHCGKCVGGFLRDSFFSETPRARHSGQRRSHHLM